VLREVTFSVTSEIFTTVKMYIMVFLVAAQYSLVGGYQPAT
jgi:hypothetical protein